MNVLILKATVTGSINDNILPRANTGNVYKTGLH